jgi:uncharacterized membrane protein YphA (DoxX/SURF4 family)
LDLTKLIPLYGSTIGRLCMAAIFLYSGQDKLRHWRQAIAEVRDLNLPFPMFAAGGTILAQLFGGLTLVINQGVIVGASLLAAFVVVATLMGHRFWLLKGDPAKQMFVTALEHLAIVGGLLLAAVNSSSAG